MQISYQIIRSSRKTIAIQITPEGQVLVRCPSRMQEGDILRFVQSKSHWIEAHLSSLHRQPQLPPLTEEALQPLARQALDCIPERVAYFAPKVGVTYGRISIRNQRTRWGSCSSKGNLNFNCLLMLAPAEVLDYVVVHELCHRKEMNHSKQFWSEVERILPDYRTREAWLKAHGAALIARMGVSRKAESEGSLKQKRPLNFQSNFTPGS